MNPSDASSNIKATVFSEVAGLLGALADPRRLEILDLIAQRPRNVETLSRLLGAGVTTVSHHLQVMKRARLVSATKDGRRVYYEPTDTALSLWSTVSDVAAQASSEVRCALIKIAAGSHDEALDYEELRRRVATGEAVVLDVRPRDEYDSGHVPGAVSAPLEELENHLDTLSRDKEILAYCRGRYCVLSYQAVRTLTQNGYHAARLAVGVTEWKGQGAALERSHT